ncbi:uncharacterized protein N0V89_011388 [Didymosphaeria variabile]|uniref:DUF7730 domain-containing protein n=1 Tax=Didymosphaeria variabile TaxID=1932322 RepID=A0A9W9C6D3_9PLEO|nr:uncharacterized protein N0V89_011388 [Didymosphaeria variabile]KAJ4345258.1 hypothetical protein N0V89_011388 [Didymosphaeria variabile]
MAPRKKAVPTASKIPKASFGKRAIVKKTKAFNIARMSRLSPQALAQAGRKKPSWQGSLLKNGLVSMEKTPPAKRNATRSPLLSLPGEIRNMIWRYAMTGNVVKISEDDERSLYDDVKTWEKIQVAFQGHAVQVQDEGSPTRWRNAFYLHEDTPVAAFHLPEVSRQIYTETATLAYPDTVFYLDTGRWGAPLFVQTWSATLTPAHKDAITDISINKNYLEYYLNESRRSFRANLPALKRIHVDESDFDLRKIVCIARHGRPLWMVWTVEELKEWIQMAVNYNEHNEVKVVFYPQPLIPDS